MEHLALREAIIATAQAMSSSGLSPGKSGNVSARVGAPQNGFFVTPTGVPYADLRAGSIVFVEPGGAVPGDQLAPSSEWHFHDAIYTAYPEAGAIVHTHSEAATALSCTGRGIPAFHYMVAVAGGPDIRCAPYATFGTDALAQNAVAALDGRKACLLGNHGVIALGETVEKAYALAQEVEGLARQYVTALTIGDVRILDAEEMARVQEKFRTYGQQPGARSATRADG
jgi:L-fuculose-phosphate aldolase